jgi:imidazolonepropionase-like amidohydrolase
MVTGKTVGGASMYPDNNRLSREEALRLYTQGSSWFSSESGRKGAIAPGQLADLVALTDDYFSVQAEQIKGIESVLTIVGGKIVQAREEFTSHAPPSIPVLPEWSPMKAFGGYSAPLDIRKAARAGVPLAASHQHNAVCQSHGCLHAWSQLVAATEHASKQYAGFWGMGCDCFAF